MKFPQNLHLITSVKEAVILVQTRCIYLAKGTLSNAYSSYLYFSDLNFSFSLKFSNPPQRIKIEKATNAKWIIFSGPPTLNLGTITCTWK